MVEHAQLMDQAILAHAQLASLARTVKSLLVHQHNVKTEELALSMDQVILVLVQLATVEPTAK